MVLLTVGIKTKPHCWLGRIKLWMCGLENLVFVVVVIIARVFVREEGEWRPSDGLSHLIEQGKGLLLFFRDFLLKSHNTNLWLVMLEGGIGFANKRRTVRIKVDGERQREGERERQERDRKRLNDRVFTFDFDWSEITILHHQACSVANLQLKSVGPVKPVRFRTIFLRPDTHKARSTCGQKFGAWGVENIYWAFISRRPPRPTTTTAKSYIAKSISLSDSEAAPKKTGGNIKVEESHPNQKRARRKASKRFFRTADLQLQPRECFFFTTRPAVLATARLETCRFFWFCLPLVSPHFCMVKNCVCVSERGLTCCKTLRRFMWF